MWFSSSKDRSDRREAERYLNFLNARLNLLIHCIIAGDQTEILAVYNVLEGMHDQCWPAKEIASWERSIGDWRFFNRYAASLGQAFIYAGVSWNESNQYPQPHGDLKITGHYDLDKMEISIPALGITHRLSDYYGVGLGQTMDQIFKRASDSGR